MERQRQMLPKDELKDLKYVPKVVEFLIEQMSYLLSSHKVTPKQLIEAFVRVEADK